MFCSKVLLTIDRPRLKFRTRFNNRRYVSRALFLNATDLGIVQQFQVIQMAESVFMANLPL